MLRLEIIKTKLFALQIYFSSVFVPHQLYTELNCLKLFLLMNLTTSTFILPQFYQYKVEFVFCSLKLFMVYQVSHSSGPKLNTKIQI